MKDDKFVRFYVYSGAQRTSVSIDKMIADLMTVRLGYIAGSKEGYSAVRSWLEGISTAMGINSLIATRAALRQISDPALLEKIKPGA